MRRAGSFPQRSWERRSPRARDFGLSPACSPARSARLFGPCLPLTRPSPFSHPQELVNLLLTGKASSNTFNDVVELDSGHGDVTLLKGVAARSDVGFLSLFEHYNVCQVPRRSSSASPTEGSGRSAASPPPPAGAVCRGRRLETNFSCDRGSGRRTLSSVCVCVYRGGGGVFSRDTEPKVKGLVLAKKHHERGGLKQRELIVRQFWSPGWFP